MSQPTLRASGTTDGRIRGGRTSKASTVGTPAANAAAAAISDSDLERALPPRPIDRSTLERQLDELEQLGPYRILGLLGQGTMGKVFLAEDQSRHRVALKVCPGKAVAGKRTYRLEQFLREGRSMARVDHQHVVQTYDVGEDRGFHYIAMELLEGDDLQAMVRNRGPFRYDRACQLVSEAAGALDVMHILGVIHRDIKPENLMLCREGRCKVVDFGLAMETKDSFELPGAIGTAHYIAPEITQGKEAVQASDVYSLAATLFFLITGRPPFTGNSQREVIRQHNQTPPPDVRRFAPGAPAGLAKVISRGLAKHPVDRYEDATQFAKALEPYLVHMPETIASRHAQAKRAVPTHKGFLNSVLASLKQAFRSRFAR